MMRAVVGALSTWPRCGKHPVPQPPASLPQSRVLHCPPATSRSVDLQVDLPADLPADLQVAGAHSGGAGDRCGAREGWVMGTEPTLAYEAVCALLNACFCTGKQCALLVRAPLLHLPSAAHPLHSPRHQGQGAAREGQYGMYVSPSSHVLCSSCLGG